MKYMGSKRSLLKNGLGHAIDREVATSTRFIDLFSGSCAVAWFVASRHAIPVWANDLQAFSAVLGAAVLCRTRPIDADSLLSKWLKNAERIRGRPIEVSARLTRADVLRSRQWCSLQRELPITAAYGGHYFSAEQALWLDALRQALPSQPQERAIALSSLLSAASYAAASPGHLAQPLQPSRTGIASIRESWNRDLLLRVTKECKLLSHLHARRSGRITTGDANVLSRRAIDGDLVFLDPPYSAVQYSRFYHVLETITQGDPVEVSGIGRYPHSSQRPNSLYSRKACALDAIEILLSTLASKGAKVILTFPTHECSNGLSGELLTEVADQFFTVKSREVSSVLSTLGGSLQKRNRTRYARRRARIETEELIVVLTPRG